MKLVSDNVFSAKSVSTTGYPARIAWHSLVCTCHITSSFRPFLQLLSTNTANPATNP